MIRRLPAALTAAVLLGAAMPAPAADVLSNSYWDASYLNSKVEIDTASTDAEGFRLGASLGLAKFLNFTGDYDQRRDRASRLGFGSAGFAYHTQDPVWQVHGAVTYERVENDDNADPANDFVEDGYGVGLGGRYVFSDVELGAAYRYLDFGTVDGTDTDFTGSRINIDAALQLGNWWSLVAGYRILEHKFETNVDSATVDYSEWTVGFRRYFVTNTDRKNRHGGVLNRFGGEEEVVE